MEDSPRILVVDDDPSISRLITFQLEMQGYLVDVVTDGQEALDAFRAQDYQAVILDLMLPSLDGFQVLQAIRRENETLPVLILSARSRENDVMKGFAAGANDYLIKPFRPSELRMRLKRMLEG